MKRNSTTSFALTAIVLSISACSSGGSDNNDNNGGGGGLGSVISPAQDGTATPFTPVTGLGPVLSPDATPVSETPDAGSPGVPFPDSPVLSGPTVPGPPTVATPAFPTTPQTSNDLPAEFFNGLSESQRVSEWQCRRPGNTDPRAFYSLQFFEDANGVYLTSGAVIEFDWLANGNDVSFSFPGDSASITLTDITFTSATQFLTTVQVTGESDDPRQCDLVDVVNPLGPVPVPSAPSPAPEQPDSPVTNSASLPQLLSNGSSESDLRSIWLCRTLNQSVFAFAFLDDNSGALADLETEFAIRWTVNDESSVLMSFQIDPTMFGVLQNVSFQSPDAFSATTFAVGNQDFGSVDCDRSAG